MQTKIATVFGGTGFVGRYIVRALVNAGYTVRVASRAPMAAYFLRPLGTPGQVVLVGYDPRDPASIARAIGTSDVVIHSVGILFEKSKNSFDRIHVELPRAVASAAAAAGVKRFVLISALGADIATSRYAKTKLAGEQAVREAFPAAAILRPSVIFGAEDDFFNRFAKLASILPFLPLIAGGHTKFQPVYVGDVAKAALAALDHPGATFSLGGPETLDMRGIYERMFHYTHRPRPLVHVPKCLALIKAAFLSLLPTPPLTCDQIKSLETDSTVPAGASTLAALNITATPLDAVLPQYLSRFRPGGPFAHEVQA